MKIHLLFIALILSLPLVITNGYSHSVTCGIGTCPVGGSPIPERPDNEILIFLSGIQGFLLIGLMFGAVCFGIFGYFGIEYPRRYVVVGCFFGANMVLGN